jgi:hypothetical protein
MKVVIDRFEGDFAICEKDDRKIINIKRANIPKDAKEGDVLDVKGDAITIDFIETANRNKSVKKLMDELWK